MSTPLTYLAKKHRQEFVDFLFAANLVNKMHISRHFCERLAERGIEMNDILRMLLPLIKIFRSQPDVIHRRFCVKWRNFTLFADIVRGPVSGERRIDLKTAYKFEHPYREFYDELIKLPDIVTAYSEEK